MQFKIQSLKNVSSNVRGITSAQNQDASVTLKANTASDSIVLNDPIFPVTSPYFGFSSREKNKVLCFKTNNENDFQTAGDFSFFLRPFNNFGTIILNLPWINFRLASVPSGEKTLISVFAEVSQPSAGPIVLVSGLATSTSPLAVVYEHIAQTITLYVDDITAINQTNVVDDRFPQRGDSASFFEEISKAPGSFGVDCDLYLSMDSSEFFDFIFEKSIWSSEQITVFKNSLDKVSKEQFFTLVKNNNLLVEDKTDNPTAFEHIDLDKFIQKDMSSASGIAALNTDGLADDTLANARSIQRLLLTGLAIGPDSLKDDKSTPISYGNRLQLDEAWYLSLFGYYSASMLGQSKDWICNLVLALADYKKLSLTTTNRHGLSDVIKQARQRNNNRGKLLIASACQRAHLVALAYMNAKNLSDPAIQAAQRLETDPTITFENQFNVSEYYEVPEDREVYSLSAYLVALRGLMDEHVTTQGAEENSLLSARRPDIDQLKLSPENASNFQPKLEIVNKVLRFHARLNDDSSDELTDAEQDSVQFPLEFPYNQAHNSIIEVLKAANTSLFAIRRALGYINSTATDTSISPSMVEVITTDNVDSYFYWGYSSAAALEGNDPDAEVNKQALKLVSNFVSRAVIEDHQLHELLFGDLSLTEIGQDKHLSLYFNSPANGFQATAQNSLRLTGDGNELENLDKLRQDRLQRFLRLSKVSGLSFVELHRLLRATGNRLNKEFIRLLSQYPRLQEDLSLNLDNFICLVANIRREGEGKAALAVQPPLERIFNRTEQSIDLLSNGALNLNWTPSGDSNNDKRIEVELSACLSLSIAEVKELAKKLRPTGVITLDHNFLSALYRFALLANTLQLTMVQLLSALEFALGINQINTLAGLTANESSVSDKLTVIEQLLCRLENFKEVGLSLPQAMTITSHTSTLTVSQQQVNNLQIQLETNLSDVPKVELAAFNQKLTETRDSTIALTQVELDTLVDQGVVKEDYLQVLAKKEGGEFVLWPLSKDFTVAERNLQVQAVTDILSAYNRDQITTFENTLAQQVLVSAKYAKVYSCWAGSVLAGDADGVPSMTERLTGANNDLRSRLLNKATDMVARRCELQMLQQLAEIIRLVALSADEWQRLLLRPELLDGFNTHALPTLDALLGLLRYIQVSNTVNNTDSPLLQVAESKPSDQTDNEDVRTEIAAELATVLGDTESRDVLLLIDIFQQGRFEQRPVYLVLNGIACIALAVDFVSKLRLLVSNIADLLKIGEGTHDSYTELEGLYKGINAALSSEKKQDPQTSGKLLEQMRDKLLPLALHKMQARGIKVSSAAELYRYLLLDVETGGEFETSQVKEACVALQLYGDGVLDNQEPKHTANNTFRSYWEWMRTFTTWQANRRIFFETENFLLPEVLRNTSAAYKNLQSGLSNAIQSPEETETVFKTYVAELVTTLDLENIGLARTTAGDELDAIVARSKIGTTRDIYLRLTNLTAENGLGRGKAEGFWQKLPLTLPENDCKSITPVYAFGQWHLYWVTYQVAGQDPQQREYLSSQLNQLIRDENGVWGSPQIIRTGFVDPERAKNQDSPGYRHVTAFAPTTYKIKGTEAQLKAIWERQGRIEQRLRMGDKVEEVFFDEIVPKDFNGTKISKDLMIQDIRQEGGNEREKLKLDEQQEYWIDILSNQKDNAINIEHSEWKQEINNATASDVSQSVDGIILSLPPVFGVFSDKISSINDMKNIVHDGKPDAGRGFVYVNSACMAKNWPTSTIDMVNKQADLLVIKKSGMIDYCSNLALVEEGTSREQVNVLGLVKQQTISLKTVYDLTPGGGDNSHFSFGTIGEQKNIQIIQEKTDDSNVHYISTNSQAALDILQRLGQFDIDTMMHPDSQRLKEASFVALLDPTKEYQVLFPRPPEQISFSGFYGAEFWELFYHAPLLLATALKNAGQYEEANKWYRYIFNPQADNSGLVVNDGLSSVTVDESTQSNVHWQSLALRQNSPAKFTGEVYRLNEEQRNSAYSNLLHFFNQYEGQPDLSFKVVKFNALTKDNTTIATFIGGEENLIYTDETKDDVVEKSKSSPKNVAFRYQGTHFMAQGNYFFQFQHTGGLALFVNGKQLCFSNPRIPSLTNVPVNIEHSGVQRIEMVHMTDPVHAEFKVRFAAAQPGVSLNISISTLSGYWSEKSNTYWNTIGDRFYDFQILGSQDISEQRLLTEVYAVDNVLAGRAYVQNPNNPHAIAQLRPSAYRIWIFYEYIDNQIKRGDKLFRQLTRESLVDAGLIYCQVLGLLGDTPTSKGVLDNMAASSILLDVRRLGLLDYDMDGNIDLQDADIQARRLVDVGQGKIQASLELLLESRLAGISRYDSSVGIPLPVEEGISGNSAEARQLSPREVQQANSTIVLVDPDTVKLESQTFLTNSYFAIPTNRRTLQLWQTLEQRLYNLRNSRDINGRRINLALTQPPLDPLALARNGAIGSGALGQIRGDQASLYPHYRFNYVIERAKSVTRTVIEFGNTLLNILERKDAAELEGLRVNQEQTILDLNKEVLATQLRSSQINIDILKEQYGTARYLEQRYASLQHFEGMPSSADVQDFSLYPIPINEETGEYDESMDKLKPYRDLSKDSDTYPTNDEEKAALSLAGIKYGLDTIAEGIDAAGSFAKVAPNIFGLAVGGQEYNSIPEGIAKIMTTTANGFGYFGDLSSTLGDYRRRKAEWEENRKVAQDDQSELRVRMKQAMEDIKVIKGQIEILAAQTKANEEIQQFINVSRVSKKELYQWLSCRMATLYFQAYQLALNIAQEAELAWNFERAESQQFIQNTHWDDLQHGLLAGQSLLMNLEQMQYSFEQQHSRRLEIVKTISLKNNVDVKSDMDSFAQTQTESGVSGNNLISLLSAESNSNRTISFELPSKLFDRDFPGHIKRQIKNVSITVPAVVGPYENLSATLTQMSNRLLLVSNADSAIGLTKRDSVSGVGVRTDYRNNQAVAISSGVNDAGMFQLNFADSRLLPFEGTGVDSKWSLEFSGNVPEAVFNSIGDIILEVRYTAEIGEGLKDTVKQAVMDADR